MQIEPIFKWFDLWIGVYINLDDKKIYIFPIPMFGICVQFTTKEKKAKGCVHINGGDDIGPAEGWTRKGNEFVKGLH